MPDIAVAVPNSLLRKLLDAATEHQHAMDNDLGGWTTDDHGDAQNEWLQQLHANYAELTEAIDAAHRLWLVAEGSA